ncbi:MAG: fibronectin type III domain-containing protein, partial [Chloroflexia bacterium]|nr:fibronectin type III domain-containing protein [Chloroflexia bacterium]
WKPSADAIGYNISYGTNETKLYQSYAVYSDTLLEINSLNVNQAYYFAIEAFNENGVSQKSPVVIGD